MYYLYIGAFIFFALLFIAEIINSKTVKRLTLDEKRYYAGPFSQFYRVSSAIGFSLAIVNVVFTLMYSNRSNFMTIFYIFCGLILAQALIIMIITLFKFRKLDNIKKFKQRYFISLFLKQIAIIALMISIYLKNTINS